MLVYSCMASRIDLCVLLVEDDGITATRGSAQVTPLGMPEDGRIIMSSDSERVLLLCLVGRSVESCLGIDSEAGASLLASLLGSLLVSLLNSLLVCLLGSVLGSLLLGSPLGSLLASLLLLDNEIFFKVSLSRPSALLTSVSWLVVVFMSSWIVWPSPLIEDSFLLRFSRDTAVSECFRWMTSSIDGPRLRNVPSVIDRTSLLRLTAILGSCVWESVSERTSDRSDTLRWRPSISKPDKPSMLGMWVAMNRWMTPKCARVCSFNSSSLRIRNSTAYIFRKIHSMQSIVY